MNRSEKLRQSRDSYTVAWREYLIAHDTGRQIIFCFFEGEDSKYYIGRIKSIFSNMINIKPLVCGGKYGVLRVNKLWGDRFQGPKLASKSLFFVDRDFDSRSQHRMCGLAYITPCYSVENLFVSKECVGSILENEFGVHTDESLENSIALNLFEKLLIEFLEASTLLNAWIFLQRKHESLCADDKRLNLKSVKFSQLFTVTQRGVSQLYSESKLPSLFPNAKLIDTNELRRYADWFRSMNRRRIFRGKYLVEFLRKVLEIIKTDRVSASPQLFPKKLPVKLGLSRENIVSELCQYADTPTCLKLFLQKVDLQPLFES